MRVAFQADSEGDESEAQDWIRLALTQVRKDFSQGGGGHSRVFIEELPQLNNQIEKLKTLLSPDELKELESWVRLKTKTAISMYSFQPEVSINRFIGEVHSLHSPFFP